MFSDPTHRKIAAKLAVWIVPAVLSVGGAIWAASAAYSQVVSGLDAAEQVVADHEQRLRLLEQHTSEVRRDVRWIRSRLEASGADAATGGDGEDLSLLVPRPPPAGEAEPPGVYGRHATDSDPGS